MRATFVLAATVLLLAGCHRSAEFPADEQVGANPRLPEQHQYLIPPMNVPGAHPWAAGEMPTVPAGFTITPLADGLQHPRSVYTLPNGDVLVTESSGPPAPVFRPKELIMGFVQDHAGAGAQGGNRLVLLRDADGDGRTESRSIFLDHLVSPFGVVLVGGDLYVANTDAVLRCPYQTGATRIALGSCSILTHLPAGRINHHWTKSLTASRDGRFLYAGVGSNSNVTENGIDAELDRAAIWEIDRQTGAHRLYATGLRNPNGLTFNPQSGQLWTVVNERDELGPNLVPDYMTSVRDGGFYGWPYSYWGGHVDPRVMPQRPDLVRRAIVPDYGLGSHVAPLGLAFYPGGGFGAHYQNGAFVGEHGSWDRTPLNGYKVAFVPFVNGRPAGRAEDFVTGFVDANGTLRGRPVGVGVDARGALLVADDVGNTVWRVTPRR